MQWIHIFFSRVFMLLRRPLSGKQGIHFAHQTLLPAFPSLCYNCLKSTKFIENPLLVQRSVLDGFVEARIPSARCFSAQAVPGERPLRTSESQRLDALDRGLHQMQASAVRRDVLPTWAFRILAPPRRCIGAAGSVPVRSNPLPYTQTKSDWSVVAKLASHHPFDTGFQLALAPRSRSRTTELSCQFPTFVSCFVDLGSVHHAVVYEFLRRNSLHFDTLVPQLCGCEGLRWVHLLAGRRNPATFGGRKFATAFAFG